MGLSVPVLFFTNKVVGDNLKEWVPVLIYSSLYFRPVLRIRIYSESAFDVETVSTFAYSDYHGTSLAV
jgi:hypothetical protein